MLKEGKRGVARKRVLPDVASKKRPDYLPELIDDYIELTDLLNKLSQERKLLQNKIKDRIQPGNNKKGYGEKKGRKNGTILYCERTQRRIDIKKIEEEMGREWVDDHKTPMTTERIEVVHRTEAYAEGLRTHIQNMKLEEILANTK